MSQTAGAELCRDCGLCCDGTLFTSVTLDEESTATARLHRLPLLETESATKLQHPCSALHGALCHIYEDRPALCAAFVCELRRKVDEAKVDARRARAIVDEAQAIKSRLAGRGAGWWSADFPPSDDRDALADIVKRHFW